MYKNKKVIVVMPAYNAAQTLKMTYDEVMAQEIVDLVILVDDASHDETPSYCRQTSQDQGSCPRKKQRIWGQSKDLLQDGSGRGRRTLSSWCIPIISTRRN